MLLKLLLAVLALKLVVVVGSGSSGGVGRQAEWLYVSLTVDG